MRETSKQMKGKEKESIYLNQGTFSKENGRTIRKMEMVLLCILVGIFSRELGNRMLFLVIIAFLCTKMVITTKEDIGEEFDQVLANTNFNLAKLSREIGLEITKSMVSSTTRMGIYIREKYTREKRKGWESTHMRMGMNSRVNGKMIRKKDKGHIGQQIEKD